MIEFNDTKERCLLVGVNTGELPDFSFAMEELGNLAEACDMIPIGMITQNIPLINKSTYVGEGKLEEIKRFLLEQDVPAVVFLDLLTPSQLSNLQTELDATVYDRTALILQIFSRRAKSREARLQVEIARLEYMLPRLTGLHKQLSRQGGTGGSMSNKGAGETQLELDRRKLNHRLTRYRHELKELTAERRVRRESRNESGVFRVALLGYTNAGKSTLLNSMQKLYGVYAGKTEETGKEVLAKDMLFATLDTTVRRIQKSGCPEFVMADTVGFISNLPHDLVDAFHSTLEEALEADLILQVIDVSDENHALQMQVTNETIKELGADEIPKIIVYNKAEIVKTEDTLPIVDGNTIYLSARSEKQVAALHDIIISKILKAYKETSYLFPYQRSDLAAYLRSVGSVIEERYEEEGIFVRARVNTADAGRLATFEK